MGCDPVKSVGKERSSMKRKFLEDLGLQKEAIDSIMAENGKDVEIQNLIDGMKFDAALKDALRAAGARNEKAVMAILGVDTLKKSRNQEKDISAAIAAAKKDSDYLFQSEKPAPRVVSTTSGMNPDADSKRSQANEALRSLFGKE